MSAARIEFVDYGLYREGLMFALIVEDEFILKTGANNAAGLERAGRHPFVYQSQGRSAYGSELRAQTAHMQVAGVGKSVRGKRK